MIKTKVLDNCKIHCTTSISNFLKIIIEKSQFKNLKLTDLFNI